MHPLLSSPKRLSAYLFAWAFIAVLLAGLMHLQGSLTFLQAIELTSLLGLFYAFDLLTPWYTSRALPLSTTSPLKLVLNHLGGAVVSTAIWTGAARLLARAFGFADRISPQMPLLIAVGFFLYGLSVALHYVWLAVQASRDAAVQAREAELRALKAQINPHFLFNSLNSIAALATVDPPRAREMCLHLSDFLRNTLGLGEKQNIFWRDEMELARTYLDVEQIRFGSRLQVKIQMENACEECQVPPLVLQPLIENAVKHGIATLIDGGQIRVDSRFREGFLHVRVENEFDPDSPAPRRRGLGLRNVRDRLETRFAGAARLEVRAEGNLYRAEMTIPCQVPE